LIHLETHKEKILVVDDEASIRRILETRLSMIGYDVVTAADGEEALDTFRNTDPDLVVLDVMMPKLDGYGVCQELRKESDVPIIMLTALGDVADRITGLELGADDYVVKPFSPKSWKPGFAQYCDGLTKWELPAFPVLASSM
jgi:OmpR family response regulator RpaB